MISAENQNTLNWTPGMFTFMPENEMPGFQYFMLE
jgi:hypothetical protein